MTASPFDGSYPSGRLGSVRWLTFTILMETYKEMGIKYPYCMKAVKKCSIAANAGFFGIIATHYTTKNLSVHAYERMNRIYNYTLDPYGPVYITVGDGGNIEQVDIDHADDPGKCPSAGDNVPEYGGVCHLNFSSGLAKVKFC
ncbi:hypothetical protein Dimus_018465 [Dionaea muscipula]